MITNIHFLSFQPAYRGAKSYSEMISDEGWKEDGDHGSGGGKKKKAHWTTREKVERDQKMLKEAAEVSIECSVPNSVHYVKIKIKACEEVACHLGLFNVFHHATSILTI